MRKEVTEFVLRSWYTEKLGFSVAFVNGHKDQEAKANAEALAELIAIRKETGLTPRQLAEQHAELLAALKKMLDDNSYYFPVGNPWGDAARAAIANAEARP